MTLQHLLKSGDISWSQFELCNPNTKTSFENMCRQMFNYHFFDGKANLHSNPNNPGIEVLPVFHEDTKKRISFQSKYLSQNSYTQIAESVKMTLKYYAGELDVLYLYCNRNLTTTCQPYKDIEELLKSNEIELVMINNQEILSQVISYPNILVFYFNFHKLTEEKFYELLEVSLDAQGSRYNVEFNVNTNIENYIDLFARNDKALKMLNNKKREAINYLEKNNWRFSEYKELVQNICDEIIKMDNVNQQNILNCLGWDIQVKKEFEKEFNKIEDRISELTIERDNIDYSIQAKKYNIVSNEIDELRRLLNFSNFLRIDKIEKQLIQNKILIVNGEAGSGKSQLFSISAKKIIDSGKHAILILGSFFMSSDLMIKQMLDYLDLDLNLDELLIVLEGIGENNNEQVVLFIDAINESWNKEGWHLALNSLFKKINNLNHVRLAISIRTGYENLVFNQAIMTEIKSGRVIQLLHYGFAEDPVKATKEFLNHYSIPFLPSYLLQHEMTNPLFLTLFCKTYDGNEYDIFSLFDLVIDKIDKECKKNLNMDSSLNLLDDFVYEIANIYLDNNKRMLSKKEILDLNFWGIHGINEKGRFITALERAGFLNTTVINGKENYTLGYNLLEDFVCAKALISRFSTMEDCVEYISDDLLKIEEDGIGSFQNIDVFVIACGLLFEAYGEDGIYIIKNIKNKDNQDFISERYIESFMWRKSTTVNEDFFINFITSHSVDSYKVWEVMIVNSLKVNHPLNALTLHRMLQKMTISHRDYLWTTYINDLCYEDERVFQLIELYDKGEHFTGMNEQSTWLVLILLSWFLTSSNRTLRDKATKALIEILKTNFYLSKKILEFFEQINDPYIRQRIYSAVFGALMKRNSSDKPILFSLSDYIMNDIFKKDIIYPDILLRDYARLIIERCVFESPDIADLIDIKIALPPYKSSGIPTVKTEIYCKKGDYGSGVCSIESSMTPDGIDGCIYGDFGRYVFQAGVEKFKEIDMENIYHYSMQFIRDELGYTNEKFSEYDDKLRSRDRHSNRKIERIGKKYQWIAFHNILARISDTHTHADWNNDIIEYKGAWNPYVRDFDPTLNRFFLSNPDAPNLNSVKEIECKWLSEKDVSIENAKLWVKENCDFFDNHKNKISINDTQGKEWISLYDYKQIGSEKDIFGGSDFGPKSKSQQIWSITQAYFVKKNQFNKFKNELIDRNFLGRWFPESGNYYTLYNREYAWSPGYKSEIENGWLNCEVKTKKNKRKEPTMKKIGEVMPAFLNFIWEEEYDASQDETTSFYIPCGDLICKLKLSQRTYDGYYYSQTGDLVAFDSCLSGNINGSLLIRKDYLEKYLDKNELSIFWTCMGEKQIFMGKHNQIWGDWSGFMYLEKSKIKGEIVHKNTQP